MAARPIIATIATLALLTMAAGCPPEEPVEVEPDAYVPASEPVIVECDVIEVRGEIVECTDPQIWCDGSEAGVERQLACCNCSAASCFVHLSSECEG